MRQQTASEVSNDNNKKVKHGQTQKTSRRYARLGVCGLSNTCMWSVARRQFAAAGFRDDKSMGWGGGGGGGGGGRGVLWESGLQERLECFGCVIRRLTTYYLACSSHVPVVHLCKNVT